MRVGALVGGLILGTLLLSPGGSDAQSRRDLEATIAALETRVAELEPSPTPAPVPREAPLLEADPIVLGRGLRLDYFYLVDDGVGGTRVLGEIVNGERAEPVDPSVQFVFYDADGNVVDAVRASSPLPVVYPGERAPLDGFGWGAPFADVARAEPSVCENHGDPTEYGSEGIELRDVVEDSRDEDSLRVRGEVFNGRAEPVDGVVVRALFYRPDGRYAGYGTALIMADIPPGKTARFDLSASALDAPGIRDAGGFTYELWAGTSPNVTVSTC